MNKIIPSLAWLIIILLSACGNPYTATPDPGPVEAYAVLAAKDNYQDVGMTDLPVDHIDIIRLRESLEALGWPGENIHELREFTRDSLIAELDWLEGTADSNDLVFFYVTGHGRYLSEEVVWRGFFPQEWEEIPGGARVLVVDSCQAGQFTAQLEGGPGNQLLIAAVDEGEYGWKGIEEEGLPIIGGVFTYYFAEALLDPAADSNGDTRISVQEAALAAERLQRKYMHEVVFEVPEFVELYHAIGVEPEKDQDFPDVIITGDLEEALFLDLRGK